MTVDNARGEQDLEMKPLKDLIAILQKDDPFVQHKREAIQKRTTRKKDKELDQGQWHFCKDGLLYYLQRLYVPDDEAVWDELIACFHEDPLAGHFGEKRTLELIQRHYHWVRIEEYINHKVSICARYQFANLRRHRPYGTLQPIPVPEGPWQEISMDFITDLPPNRNNKAVYNAILVMVDRFSKMSLYIPAKKT